MRNAVVANSFCCHNFTTTSSSSSSSSRLGDSECTAQCDSSLLIALHYNNNNNNDNDNNKGVSEWPSECTVELSTIHCS